MRIETDGTAITNEATTGQASAQQISSVEQARQIWLDKLVQFDLQRGYGVQYGRVVEITDDGDVFVACLPGYDRPVAALAFTLGYLYVLTAVEV